MSSISISALSIFEPLIFHIGAVEPADVIGIEHRLHRLDGFQRLANLFEQRSLQHAGVGRRFVGVIFKNVPAAEDQVFHSGQRNEILDLGRPAIGALAEPDGAQLRQGPDRLAEPTLYRLHAGHERGADRAHARNQDP